MPQMDGLTLAAWMRAQVHLHTTPILVLSSAPQKDDSERARSLNLQGYLTKPFTDVDLLGAVKRALGIAETDSALTSPGGLQPPATGRILAVLLVEDDPINQQLALRLLAKWGHQVTLAVHGQEAVDRLREGQRYDIVLMDMQMPGMGGIEATRLIRADEAGQKKPRVPIMAMTANAMQGDREACLEAGMDEYLSKPINKSELAAKLRMFGPAGPSTERPSAAFAVPPASTFDYAAAISRMDPEMIEILTQAFLEHHEKELNSLRQSIATLAGFDAKPAERYAAEMEVLAEAGHLEALLPLLEALENEIGRLVKVLRG
jgi:CheY-like chemotaxis protein